MRVAQVGNFDPDSADGTDKVVVGLSTWLPRHDVETEVWQLTRTDSQSDVRDLDGVRVTNHSAVPRPWSYVRGLTRSAREFIDRRQTEVDLVHFHSALIPEHVAAARRLRVPYVISPQGGYSRGILLGRHRWFKSPWMRLREGPYARGAAFLHSVSGREADGLRVVFPGVPIVVIRAGVDAPPLPDANHRPGRHAFPKELLYLGRMVISQKGLDVLLHGYAGFLKRSGDQQTRLVLMGPDFQGGRAQLQALARLLGISERVAFREPAYGPAKWTCLSTAYALVHPSRWEGLPNSILEAMAASCPVLVTPGTNVSDLVRDHFAGVAVDCTAGGVSSGLETLMSLNGDRYVEMSQRARALVDEEFSWSVAAERIARAYSDLCHPPRTARP